MFCNATRDDATREGREIERIKVVEGLKVKNNII